MRMLGRVIGWLFLAAGLVAGGIDLWASLRNGKLTLASLGKHWYEFDVSSLNAAQAGVERHIWEPLWLDYIQPILEMPAVVVLTLIGLLVLFLCRRRGGGRWFTRR